MAAQALKCPIEGHTGEPENPIESDFCNCIYSTLINYPFDNTILSDLILTFCNEWKRTSCLAAVKMPCMMEHRGVSLKDRSQFVLQCPMILQEQIASSFEMSWPKHYCCPCWKKKHLAIMPQTKKFYNKPPPLPNCHCKSKNGDLHLHKNEQSCRSGFKR